MGNNVDNVEFLLEKLFNFYKVSTAAELSEKINTSQKTISNWKVRNSISAIKKKCRELGIYNEIFGDLNLGVLIHQGNNSRAGGRDYIEGSNKNEENSLIPDSILIELNSLFERIKNKDEKFIKEITYKIEDYINEIKRQTRN